MMILWEENQERLYFVWGKICWRWWDNSDIWEGLWKINMMTDQQSALMRGSKGGAGDDMGGSYGERDMVSDYMACSTVWYFSASSYMVWIHEWLLR